MSLNVGDAAPDFELPDHTGRLIRLHDFRGKSSVVLAFYVYANTPGWTQELAAYQDGLADFEKMGARILGISINKADDNRRFAEKLGLVFPLLSDGEKKVSHAYGVLNFLRLAKRTTFVIDAAGVIRHIDRGKQAIDPTSALHACSLLAPHSSWRDHFLVAALSSSPERATEQTAGMPIGAKPPALIVTGWQAD